MWWWGQSEPTVDLIHRITRGLSIASSLTLLCINLLFDINTTLAIYNPGNGHKHEVYRFSISFSVLGAALATSFPLNHRSGLRQPLLFFFFFKLCVLCTRTIYSVWYVNDAFMHVTSSQWNFQFEILNQSPFEYINLCRHFHWVWMAYTYKKRWMAWRYGASKASL